MNFPIGSCPEALKNIGLVFELMVIQIYSLFTRYQIIFSLEISNSSWETLSKHLFYLNLTGFELFLFENREFKDNLSRC